MRFIDGSAGEDQHGEGRCKTGVSGVVAGRLKAADLEGKGRTVWRFPTHCWLI